MPNLSKFRTAKLTIDGQPVELRVARLKLEESEAYKARLRALLADTEQELTGDEAVFVRTSIETYLSLAPGALTVDGDPVTTGAQLLEIIGENPGLVFRALLAIGGMTSVSDEEGKRSASESVSVPSSDGPDQAPDGPRPAPTADGVAPADCAPLVDATAATVPQSSGRTATSS